jgi:hypothetical protein
MKSQTILQLTGVIMHNVGGHPNLMHYEVYVFSDLSRSVTPSDFVTTSEKIGRVRRFRAK